MYSRSSRPVPPPDYSGVAYRPADESAPENAPNRTSPRQSQSFESDYDPRRPIDTEEEYLSSRRRSASMPDTYPAGDNLPLKISETYRNYIAGSPSQRGGDSDERVGFPHEASNLRRYTVRHRPQRSNGEGEIQSGGESSVHENASISDIIKNIPASRPDKKPPEKPSEKSEKAPSGLLSFLTSGAGGPLSKLSEKSLTFEDLMLIGLILLLLQNDADNDVIILLGFLLIVGF